MWDQSWQVGGCDADSPLSADSSVTPGIQKENPGNALQKEGPLLQRRPFHRREQLPWRGRFTEGEYFFFSLFKSANIYCVPALIVVDRGEFACLFSYILGRNGVQTGQTEDYICLVLHWDTTWEARKDL